MTEMDAHSRRELRERVLEREEMEEQIRELRKRVLAATVDSVREIASRGYSDPEIARELGVRRTTVNAWRRFGTARPPKQKATPALDSAG